MEPSPAAICGGLVLHTQIWPVLSNGELTAQRAADPKPEILDQAQVPALCAWAERSDAAGQLGALFDRRKG